MIPLRKINAHCADDGATRGGQVDTWHSTHADGVEVYHFPGGQTEVHNAGGTKDIRFPDGSVRHITSDGLSAHVQLTPTALHSLPSMVAAA